MTKILSIICVMSALGGGTAFYFDKNDADGSDADKRKLVFEVQRGDLPITLTENGTLVAKKSQKVSSKSRRSGKITYIIEEGEKVKEGDLICKLDTTELEQKLESVELEILQITANLKAARTEAEIQVTENESTIEKAEQAVKKARNDLAKYRDGDIPKDLRKFQIAIKDAETQHKLLKKRYEDSLKLRKQDYIKKSELEQDQIAYEKAQVQLEGAKLDFKMYEKYDRPMGMTEKEVAMRDADRTVKNARKRADAAVQQKKVRVVQYEKQLEKTNERVKKIKEDIQHFTLKAPCPGYVIYGDPREEWYRENIKVGGTVWGGNPVVTIPDLRVMQVKLKVHEADINKLREGLLVTVTMDSYPGLTLEGKVTQIASIASGSEGWGESAVKKFGVKITIEDMPKKLQLKPGISAKAEIAIDTVRDAIHVPIQCVFTESGKQSCYVRGEDGQPEHRNVEVGLSNDSFIVIKSGLAAGEMVLLYNPDVPVSGGSDTKAKDEENDDEAKVER